MAETESKALVRKRTDTELMPPPQQQPSAKRIKRPKNVLDEITYTEALSEIIARDFFPGLLESQTQQEYLDALESKDEEWISSATRRLKNVMTPGRRRMPSASTLPQPADTSRGFAGDTPATVQSTPAATTVAPEKPAVDTSLGLAAFQSRYTSEDNESFYKLLDKQNQKKAEKYAWLWTGNKMPSKMQLKQKEVEERISKTRSLADDGYKKMQLAIKDKDDRKAAPEYWKWQPRNDLMFKPDGVEDAMETIAERAEAASRAPPKEIVYANTRAPNPNIVVQQDPSRPPSPTLSAMRDAIAGRPRAADLDSATGGGSETPRVNGYAFVDDEDPAPESARKPTESILSLSGGDATANPFKLQDRRKREDLHHRMVDRIAESRRTASRIGMVGKEVKTPVPKFPSSPRVTGGLTPAAQRLWSNLGGAGRKSDSITPFDHRAAPRAKPALPKRATPKT
ncbi:hypothetical protein PpBr36_07418 [Pyricularia pennisetigena]|uniref:hypothetical protein n=1 Tax=Pyricularia pennisetigena TaxID=1578925 RepID=UPI001151221E|nr:hypothetical protein PpBr36_07418 [Pyricularia pennisetigena]TLS25304.1 hypothetical protein PpBr36_07418 [Pyricularia pennisetigena]